MAHLCDTDFCPELHEPALKHTDITDAENPLFEIFAELFDVSYENKNDDKKSEALCI